jgi:hypothetical protein
MDGKKAWALADMKITEQKDWEKYKKCDPKHDVTHEPDVTNYLSFLQELPKVTLDNARQIVAQLQYTEDVKYYLYGRDSLQIMVEMNALYYKARSERDTKREKWCQTYVNAFRAITAQKLEEITSAYAIVSIFAAKIIRSIECRYPRRAKESGAEQEGNGASI